MGQRGEGKGEVNAVQGRSSAGGGAMGGEPDRLHLNSDQACYQSLGQQGYGVACGCSAGSWPLLTPAASSHAVAAVPPSHLHLHLPCMSAESKA